MSKKRHRAREYAVQALYQWQVTGNETSQILQQFALEKKSTTYEVEYFKDLVLGVVTRLADLDEAITPLIDRDIEQVDLVERAVLRLAAYELLKHPEIPYRVIINEAVELTKMFGAEMGHRYVNGVVDKMARSIRAIEFNAVREAAKKR